MAPTEALTSCCHSDCNGFKDGVRSPANIYMLTLSLVFRRIRGVFCNHPFAQINHGCLTCTYRATSATAVRELSKFTATHQARTRTNHNPRYIFHSSCVYMHAPGPQNVVFWQVFRSSRAGPKIIMTAALQLMAIQQLRVPMYKQIQIHAKAMGSCRSRTLKRLRLAASHSARAPFLWWDTGNSAVNDVSPLAKSLAARIWVCFWSLGSCLCMCVCVCICIFVYVCVCALTWMWTIHPLP